MSSTDDQARRAEARRRARLAARGELPEPEDEVTDEVEAPARGGFLGRIFPPAPPLPGRPDPLAGFDPSGSLRPIRERAFLLRQAPLVWIGLGAVAALGYIALQFWSTTPLGMVGTFAQFGALIAAGWFGWQRPTLFGTAAGVVCWVLSTVFIAYAFTVRGAPPGAIMTLTSIITSFAVQLAYQAGLGFLGGWYGGYLRRRQSQLSAEVKRRR